MNCPSFITSAAWKRWLCDASNEGFPGRTGWMLHETFDAIAMAIRLGMIHPDAEDFRFEVPTGCESLGEDGGEEVAVKVGFQTDKRGEPRLILSLDGEGEAVLYACGRARAFADGTLIDAGAIAKEAGLKHPVALTREAWAECVAIPGRMIGRQNETDRLRNILELLVVAAKGRQGNSPELRFSVHVQGSSGDPKPVPLRAVSGPDDDGSPCITVMLEGDD
jgi:hypothetical protein